jgi:hypothetical protein
VDRDNPATPGALDTGLDAIDPVERALARALTEASEAGRFDVVLQLVKELEARRLARASNVVAANPTLRRPR